MMSDNADPDTARKLVEDPRNWNQFVEVLTERDHGEMVTVMHPPNLRAGFESGLAIDVVGVKLPTGPLDDEVFDDVSSPEELPFLADRMIVDPPGEVEEFEVLFELRGTLEGTDDNEQT